MPLEEKLPGLGTPSLALRFYPSQISCHLGEGKEVKSPLGSFTTSCYMDCCQCCGSEAESLLLHMRTKCVLWFCDHLVACLN